MADEIDKQIPTEPVQPDATPDKSGNKGTEDINPAWLPGRLADARKAAENKMLKDLGFEKPADLAAYVAAKREAEKAQMTEADRLKADLEAARAALTVAKQTADSERQARQTERIENSIRATAATNRAEVPADVVLWLRAENKIDPTKLLGEDGALNEAAIAALVADAKKARPSWFARTGVGSPSNAGGAPPEANQKAREETRVQLARRLKNNF